MKREDLIEIKTELPGPKAKEYIQLSKDYEPNSTSANVPCVWDHAKGINVWDVDGNKFLDFTSGVLVANVGHSHPELVEVMKDQAEQMVNSYDFVNKYRGQLAKKLVEISGDHFGKVFFVSAGTEAVEAAIKIARKYTGKKEIISFHGAFHGRTYMSMSLGGKRSGAGTKGFGPFMPGVYNVPYANCYRCAFGKTYPECDLQCFKYLDYFLDCATEKDVAAVIAEPYQGAPGTIIPPKEWFQKLEKWAHDMGALLIIDEVQASFGRTGKLFAYEHFDIKPDLLTVGKGISSSIPISAVIGRTEIMDILSPGSLSSTHGGNAFSTRVALKNIEIILREKLWENADKLGKYILERMKKVEKDVEILGEARGWGCVLALEIVKSKKTKEPDAEIAKEINYKCWKKGLLMFAPIGHYGNVLRLAPPLVMTIEEASVACDILEEVLYEYK